VGEDVSADRCDGVSIAELLSKSGDALEGGDEDAAGAAGGIEDADGVECGEECVRIADADLLTGERGADGVGWEFECVCECIVDK
jgi:hypothetical protein